MSGPLTGRVAIVTGAANPIGRAIAERLLKDGAKLVLSDIEPGSLKTYAMDLGAGVAWLASDLSKGGEADALVNFAKEQFNRIDILVNNTDSCVHMPVFRSVPDLSHHNLEKTIRKYLWCCRAALPSMVDRNFGRIISVGTYSVRHVLPAHAGFNSAIGGVHSLTKVLAQEFEKSDITVNTVAPCMVVKPSVKTAIDAAHPLIYEFVPKIPKSTPRKEFEVASMAAYLATNEAAFVTGQVFSVNGGAR